MGCLFAIKVRHFFPCAVARGRYKFEVLIWAVPAWAHEKGGRDDAVATCLRNNALITGRIRNFWSVAKTIRIASQKSLAGGVIIT